MRMPSDLVSLFTGETGLEWRFSPSELCYYSFYMGELNSKVTGSRVPNPEETFKSRCLEYDISEDSEQAKLIKPSSDMYKIWNDWIGRS